MNNRFDSRITFVHKVETLAKNIIIIIIIVIFYLTDDI